MTTLRELALLRLVAQRIAGPGFGSAAETVRWLTAAQAQDYPGALTSIALRSGARGRSSMIAALDGGLVVRSWPMRGTLHFVAAEDLPWMLKLTGARTLSGAGARHRAPSIDESAVEEARAIALDALDGASAGLQCKYVCAISCKSAQVRLKEWAEGQGVSYRTALNWFHAGTLPVSARQLPTGTILVDVPAASTAGRTVAYCRVSSSDQRPDLERQAGRVAEGCSRLGITFSSTVTEVGSGLNAHRPELRKLLSDPAVTTIVVEHRDRLARFGVEDLEAE
ncbi:MAG: IS607 family transposase [Nocardiaceae bacterium]|nr:IS607 family transposase [Nocardiaceae bacterium]